jgi:ATP-dependent DNA helicase RecQ
LALLPTGGGKSICFQIPALFLNGTTIVVSPLIALMKDQVDHLVKRGIAAGAIYSGMSKSAQLEMMHKTERGEMKILYVSPERLRSRSFRSFCLQLNIDLVAVDEAHCISQWGHDFRTDYLHLADFISFAGNPKSMALTATATQNVIDDIIKVMQWPDHVQVFRQSFKRDNLFWQVRHERNKLKALTEMFSPPSGSGIVYVRNRRSCQQISEYLSEQGVRSSFYHAGLNSDTRKVRQKQWQENELDVIVCTNAFGMGIDKNDVRQVVHYELPEDPESYYQEAGRAGRDGKPAKCIMLYAEGDLEKLDKRLDLQYPALSVIRQVYEELGNYLRLAVGSGKGVTFPFDFTSFCEKRNLKPTICWHGLQILQKNGLIRLNDGFKDESRLRILYSNKELYQLQVKDPRTDQFVRSLLRVYGGHLFNEHLQINERLLVRKSGMKDADWQACLQRLINAKCLSYQPKLTSDSITWTSERLKAAHIDEQLYTALKRNARIRASAMYAYVQTKTICRTKVLLKYFDETLEEDCNQCDICLIKNTKQSSPADMSRLMREWSLIQKGTIITFDVIKDMLQTEDRMMQIRALRLLADQGKIRRNDAMKWEKV